MTLSVPCVPNLRSVSSSFRKVDIPCRRHLRIFTFSCLPTILRYLSRDTDLLLTHSIFVLHLRTGVLLHKLELNSSGYLLVTIYKKIPSFNGEIEAVNIYTDYNDSVTILQISYLISFVILHVTSRTLYHSGVIY